MSENIEIILWVLGGVFVCIAAGAGGFLKLYAMIYDLRESLGRLETKFEMLGFSAARVLHSPHTPELDALLEKYSEGCMMGEDWMKLEKLVLLIETDVTLPKEERALAGIIRAVCHDKTGRPAEKPKKHDDNTVIVNKDTGK
jgi:hypothetical protein